MFEPNMRIKLKFESALVEEQVENLVYDAGNFLAAMGGNLGLFLGFSCLSILFSFINYLKKIFNKKLFKKKIENL